MFELILIGLFITFLIGLLWFIVNLSNGSGGNLRSNKSKDDMAIWPYQPMPIMTDTEVLFFIKLRKALPEFYIFSQVQLSRIIEPDEATQADRNFWFNRICRQSIDYVLVGDDLQTVLVAIELDDWTHQSTQSENRDEKKNKALASAGIPIVRFHCERMPSPKIIRNEIIKVLQAYAD